MWENLVNHLEDSRIFRRETNPFIMFKKQNSMFSGRVTVSYPFLVEGNIYLTNNGFDYTSFHNNFSPNVPFHLGLKSNGDFTTNFNFNFRIKSDKIPTHLQENTFHFDLTGNYHGPITAVFGVKHQNKASFSFSVHPYMLGFKYFNDRFGGEFVYSFEEEQPAISFLFNKRIDRTQVSTLASIYGNVSALVTSDFDKFRISSFFEANLFTFYSNATFGVQVPIKDSFWNASVSLPSKIITLEVALNQEDENANKQGITAYVPIDFKAIKDYFI